MSELQEIPRDPILGRRQFGIGTLLWLTTIAAATIALLKFFGFGILLLAIPILALAVVFKCGFLAVYNEKGTQFSHAILSALIFFLIACYTVDVSLSWFEDSEIVVVSILLGIGWLLVCSAMVRGHRATKVLAGFIALPYFYVILAILAGTNWSSVSRYWLGRLGP